MHFTESCDEGLPRLVVHAETAPANVHEAMRVEPIHAALAAKGLAPSEHLADSAYMSADLLAEARERHGIDPIGPQRRNLGLTQPSCYQPQSSAAHPRSNAFEEELR